MPKLPTIALSLTALASSSAFAGERTITLAIKNMYCAAYPHTVKASLEAVSGVKQATVSYKEKIAVVIYDADQTNVMALTSATTNAGYPSAPNG